VLRTIHDRPDFQSLDLHLLGRARPVRLFRRQGQSSWRGPDAEVIAHFLHTHLADNRFQVTALWGTPVDLAEADRRLARLSDDEHRLRNLNRAIRYVFVPLLVALFVILIDPWNRPNPANWGQAEWMAVALAAVLIGLQATLAFGVAHVQGRDLRRRRDEILRWRVAHAGPFPGRIINAI
jgi:hypothetical protein